MWSTTTTKTLNLFREYINDELKSNYYFNIDGAWKKKFLGKFWEFSNIIGEKQGIIYKDSKNFIETKFFENSHLNYTENCLQLNTNDEAIIYYNEQKHLKKII